MDATSLKVKFHFFSHHTFMKSPFDLFIKQLVLKTGRIDLHVCRMCDATRTDQ